MHPAFQLYETATPELIQFLSNTVLGTHGAKYQHLDTQERIEQLENPLHLSLIRSEKILGNITFSRRGKNWYVRYFAFDVLYKRSSKKNNQQSKKSILKNEIRQFFKNKLDSGEVDCFYAYIDPKNDNSHLLAKVLGFRKANKLTTQTFSRFRPTISTRFTLIDDLNMQRGLIHNQFSNYSFFHEQNHLGKMYCLRNEQSEIIAFACCHLLKWKIHRLPGKLGQLAVNFIPFVPVLNQLINPHHHKFIGIDNVWVVDNDSELLDELFNSILAYEKLKLIVWWANTSDVALYNKTNWGAMHALFNSSPVNLYYQSNSLNDMFLNHFSVATDFS